MTIRFLDVKEFATLTPLSLLISYKFSFPVVGLKIPSISTLLLKSPKLMWCLKNLSITRSNSLWQLYFVSSVLSSVEA
jgi:hypothetical protein